MSVSKNARRPGTYEVRWREGGRRLSRTFDRKGDAQAFDLDVRRRKQLGALAPSVIQSRQTLAEFVEQDWWPHHAIPNLAPDTRRRYLEVWGKHLLPRIGGYELRQISPLIIEELRGELGQATGAPTARKALMLLQGIMRRALVHGLIPLNPVQVVTKPKQKPTMRPQPLDPLTIERIRAGLRPRDQMIISLLAYAGLRPSEDRAVCWGDLDGRTLHVFASKTGRARDIALLAPLADDLAEWRRASGRPGTKELIVPRFTGGHWEREDWANWRRRIWRPAAIAAGVEGDLRPYRLRGSFVSLLLWEGRSLPYVAEQAGHSIATLANHYAGVIRNLEDQPRVSAAEAIEQARAVLATEPTS
jgi:integrase